MADIWTRYGIVHRPSFDKYFQYFTFSSMQRLQLKTGQTRVNIPNGKKHLAISPPTILDHAC